MKHTKHKAGGRKQDIYDQYIKRAFMCVCVCRRSRVCRVEEASHDTASHKPFIVVIVCTVLRGI